MPWISGAISAGASLLGSSMASDSSGKAVEAQQQATQAAIAEQRQQYEQTRTDQAPWRKAGSASLSRLSQLLGIGGTPGGAGSVEGVRNANDISPIMQRYMDRSGTTDWASVAPELRNMAYGEESDSRIPGGPDSSAADYGSLNRKFTLADFWDDPVTKASYQMGLDQGTKGINNMAGARGGRDSGATLKALTRFGTDYTGQQAAGSQQRYKADKAATYNRYSGLAGSGQVAQQATSAAGQNMGNNVSGLISGMGNARGAAAIAGGNAWQSGLQNIGNWYNQNQMIDRIKGVGGGGYNSGAGNPDYSYGFGRGGNFTSEFDYPIPS